MSRKSSFGAALALCCAVAMAGSALAANPSDPVRLHPIDGGHWQGQAGLPDARGGSDQGLVRIVDGTDDHPEVAAITGLEGSDTSEIDRLGFTVAGNEAGINPCFRVAFTDALGNPGEVMITTRMMRAESSREPGWTIYTFDTGLPLGGTIDAIEVGVHVESLPPDPGRVLFDNIVVNDTTIGGPGDNGIGGPGD